MEIEISIRVINDNSTIARTANLIVPEEVAFASIDAAIALTEAILSKAVDKLMETKQ